MSELKLDPAVIDSVAGTLRNINENTEKVIEAIYGNDSVSKAMVRSMRAYADYLRFAEAQYKEAQIRAINKADGLKRRWF